MTECRECQLWEENCICSKCPNCKSKDYIRIEIKKVHSLIDSVKINIFLVFCNECSNVFSIKI